jgi:aspartate-semialdehyde dehydrogenase
MALKPLHDAHPISGVRVSTYQSVTGTGKAAVDQLENERNGNFDGPMAYAYPIDKNCIPHCDVFTENGYTKEEMKLHHETKKILGDQSVQVSATAVRVPVQGGHSESVLVTFRSARPTLAEVRRLLAAMPGVVVQDNPAAKEYPMPRFAEGRDEVFVGRIREDLVCDRSIHLWIVADNLRKGAATNAVQIAERLISAGFLR